MTTAVLNMPLRPTWARYRQTFIARGGMSIFRTLEYEELFKLRFSGKVLDFGGGEASHYLPQLRAASNDMTYESANISTHMKPTHLVNVGDRLPMADNEYDMVIAFNTLEHVYELDQTLDEIVRVLKPGGKIVFSVPFLYRVHGSPNDFNRPTFSWWEKSLCGRDLERVELTPIMWDAISAGLSVTEGVGPLFGLRRMLVPLYGVFVGWYKSCGREERYAANSFATTMTHYTLGYVIQGYKPLQSINRSVRLSPAEASGSLDGDLDPSKVSS